MIASDRPLTQLPPTLRSIAFDLDDARLRTMDVARITEARQLTPQECLIAAQQDERERINPSPLPPTPTHQCPTGAPGCPWNSHQAA